MKLITKIASIVLMGACLSGTGFGGVLFSLGEINLEAIVFTEDMDFPVTTDGSDSSLLLVLKDVYAAPTTIKSYFPSDAQVFGNAGASLNSAISSDASWYAAMVDGSPEPPPGIDIESVDLFIAYQFSGYDPYESPWNLAVGDKITIKAGSILDISDLDVPNPDNLKGSVTAQIFASNFPVAFTDEKTIGVVPEPGVVGLFFGIFGMALVALRKRSNHPLVVTPQP